MWGVENFSGEINEKNWEIAKCRILLFRKKTLDKIAQKSWARLPFPAWSKGLFLALRLQFAA